MGAMKFHGLHENSDIWSLYEDISDTFSNDEITESKNKIINTNNEDEDIDNEMCRNCNTITDFKIEDGYKWCSECGENNGIFIDTTPEWRFYGSEDSKSSDPTRCGMPVNNLLSNMSCGTMISSKGNSPEVKRLRTIHKYITSNYNDRAILSIFENLNIIA